MSFTNTLNNIEANETSLDNTAATDNADDKGLRYRLGQVPASEYPAELQNSNTDISFSGDHKTYTSETTFNADTTTEWHIGDTATIGTSPTQKVYFYVGTDGDTNDGSTFLADNFIELNGITTVAMNDITDVTISSAAPDNVLQYDGSAWVNITPANLGADMVLNNIGDVSQTFAANQYLRRNSANTAWEASSIELSSSNISFETKNYNTTIVTSQTSYALTSFTEVGGTAAPVAFAGNREVYYNGLRLIENTGGGTGGDFTISGSSLTLTSAALAAMEVGDNLTLVNVDVTLA